MLEGNQTYETLLEYGTAYCLRQLVLYSSVVK